MIGYIENFIISRIIYLGYSLRIFVSLILEFLPLLRRPGLFTKQIYFLGNQSFVIIAVSGLFVGFVLALQVYYILNRYSSEEELGLLVAISLVRDLGPVLTALLFEGRAGTSLTAEIGLMKSGEQLTALEMMGIDPIKNIMAPRMLAGVVVMPMLTAVFNAIGILGGYIVSLILISIDPSAFWSQMQNGVDTWYDIGNGLLKSILFGFATTFIALFHGYESRPTPEGISSATTKTVVYGSLIVLGFNFILTALMFS
ncbi:MAG: lipid asymmetry maintenance ABC transporter permease subunit MlaE [Burkholderia sp.]|nr:lipid asymmetry maintenance ABC transporter permease subunit MlaE [Burkholderia sp.]